MPCIKYLSAWNTRSIFCFLVCILFDKYSSPYLFAVQHLCVCVERRGKKGVSWWLSGLRVQCCHYCGTNLIPSIPDPGISISHRQGKKKKKEEEGEREQEGIYAICFGAIYFDSVDPCASLCTCIFITKIIWALMYISASDIVHFPSFFFSPVVCPHYSHLLIKLGFCIKKKSLKGQSLNLGEAKSIA